MNEGAWLFLARFIQFIFLGLVGVCLALSYQRAVSSGRGFRGFFLKQAKRGISLLLFAFGITLITWMAVPDEYVRFGILHFIATSILLLNFLTPFPLLSLIFSIIVIWISTMVPLTTISSSWLIPLGISSAGLRTIDYFPLFPWMSVVAVGIFLGHVLYAGGKRRFHFPDMAFGPVRVTLSQIGSHSLLVYLIHIPLLMGIILSYQFLFFS